MAALTLLLVLAGVGGVVAWLTASGTVQNQFELGTVEPTVNEDGPTEGTPFEEGDNIKQNVTVTNDGNVPVYVRAQVSIYWLDANGNQLWDEPYMGEKEPDQPTGVIIPPGDYMLKWGDSVVGQPGSTSMEDGAWIKGPDGFYYWSLPIDPEGETKELIESCEYYGEYADGRTFHVDISVQGIQAEPARAVVEAWSTETQTVMIDPSTKQLTITQEGAGA